MLALWKACRGPETEREKELKEAYDGLKCLEKELGDKLFSDERRLDTFFRMRDDWICRYSS